MNKKRKEGALFLLPSSDGIQTLSFVQNKSTHLTYYYLEPEIVICAG